MHASEVFFPNDPSTRKPAPPLVLFTVYMFHTLCYIHIHASTRAHKTLHIHTHTSESSVSAPLCIISRGLKFLLTIQRVGDRRVANAMTVNFSCDGDCKFTATFLNDVCFHFTGPAPLAGACPSFVRMPPLLPTKRFIIVLF